MPRRKIIELSWTGLYDRGWGKNLVPAAYQHPAKVSFLLSEKIFDFMFEQGWLREGQTVLDPFFGIGGFALAGMRHGCHMIGVELEPKFVALANENIALWNSRYQGKLPRWGTARVVQGDSRRLRDVIAGANALTASPPYANQAIEKNSKSIDRHKQYETYRAQGGGASFDAFCATQELHSQGYGTTPGQLAALRKSELRDALVSSPPYAGARVGDECGAEHVGNGKNYGATEGQLGAMPEGLISSSPYAGSINATDKTHDVKTEGDRERILKATGIRLGGGQLANKNRYGSSPAQLGSMKEGRFEASVSSPPYIPKSDRRVAWGHDHEALQREDEKRGYPPVTTFRGSYSNDPANIGNPTGADQETFWEASRVILEQCYAALAPGGHAAWVVKDFVRNKQIVPFCDQWKQLCESVGFETVAIARAWQTTDHGTQTAMDGNHKRLTKEKKGFFRRLHEKKYPDTRIDYEIVLFQVKR